ncbi:MAG TPA: cytochrome c [Terriglobia bacterium]|nr:cytochrome c [Terriglobia bacterium]
MRSRTRKSVLVLCVVGMTLAIVPVSWAKGKETLSPTALAGKKVFDQNCSLCHFPNQTGNKIGPGLKGLFKSKELPYSHRPVTEANVLEQIEKGNAQGKPMPMPAFGTKLSKTEISDLIAYLKTL